MPSIEDLRARLQKVREEFIQQLPEMATLNTIAAKALIEKNIREIGFGAQYSGNPVPAFFFLGKEKSKAGERYIQGKVDKNELMTWADLRRAEGLPTDHVDLGFTNKMWAGMGPQEPYNQGTIVYCPLGGNSVEVVNKMNWNRARYGDFLGKVLTKKEVEILTQVLFERIAVILKNNGFNPG